MIRQVFSFSLRWSPVTPLHFKRKFCVRTGLFHRRNLGSKVRFSTSVISLHKKISRESSLKTGKAAVQPESPLDGDGDTDADSSIVKSKFTSSKKKAMIEYYSSNENLSSVYQSIPNEFLSAKSKISLFYLAEESTADKILSHLLKHIPSTCDYVIEANPGPGLLTHKLLSHGYRLKVYEASEPFINPLMDLSKKNSNLLSVQLLNFLLIPRYTRVDFLENTAHVDLVLGNLERKDWESDTLKIILGIPEGRFLIFLTLDCFREEGLPTYGCPEMYCLISPLQFTPLVSTPSVDKQMYQYFSILFQTAFDYEILDTLPRQSFLPWVYHQKMSRNSWRAKLKELDENCMYLVKISGKKNFYRSFDNCLDTLQLYQKFVSQFFRRPNHPVIPTLERWFPNCGPKLIASGIGVFTYFSDLSTREVQALFWLCKKFPGFTKMPFLLDHNFETDFEKDPDDGQEDPKKSETDEDDDFRKL